ncbi:hypothetical protein Dimus_008043 [Dionaea muscipula]
MGRVGSQRSYSANPNDYQLLEEIGSGATATVNRAIYLPFNEVLAVKRLDLDRMNSKLGMETLVPLSTDHPIDTARSPIAHEPSIHELPTQFALVPTRPYCSSLKFKLGGLRAGGFKSAVPRLGVGSSLRTRLDRRPLPA